MDEIFHGIDLWELQREAAQTRSISITIRSLRSWPTSGGKERELCTADSGGWLLSHLKTPIGSD